MRPLSKIAPDWWDYTTLDRAILDEAAAPDARGPARPGRPGLHREFYDDAAKSSTWPRRWNISTAWRQATADNPAGICGPIGPTEQLPLVARLVNELDLDAAPLPFLGHGRVGRGRARGARSTYPLCFARADMELCFNRIRPELRDAQREPALPRRRPRGVSSRARSQARCLVMQGGQGEVKHWAFNDPPRRERPYTTTPPPRRRNTASWRRAWSTCTR